MGWHDYWKGDCYWARRIAFIQSMFDNAPVDGPLPMQSMDSTEPNRGYEVRRSGSRIPIMLKGVRRLKKIKIY